jgi:transposase
MGKKDAVPNRQYTTEFRQEAVRLAGSIGGNAAAKRLGVPQSTVTSWVRRARTGTLQNVPAEASPIKRPASELEAEISRLRRELANAKLDLEIVKKAAAYFAKESRRSTPGSKPIATCTV